MDALLEQARLIYEGEIDFSGQALAEFLTYTLLSISGILAFLVGYASQDIYQTLYVGGVGTVLTFLVVVPPWPFFKRNGLRWLPAAKMSGVQGVYHVEVDGKKIS